MQRSGKEHITHGLQGNKCSCSIFIILLILPWWWITSCTWFLQPNSQASIHQPPLFFFLGKQTIVKILSTALGHPTAEKALKQQQSKTLLRITPGCCAWPSSASFGWYLHTATDGLGPAHCRVYCMLLGSQGQYQGCQFSGRRHIKMGTEEVLNMQTITFCF